VRVRIHAVLLDGTVQVTVHHFRKVTNSQFRIEVVGWRAVELECLTPTASIISVAGVGAGVEAVWFVGTIESRGWRSSCGRKKGSCHLTLSWKVNVPNVTEIRRLDMSPKHVESVQLGNVGRGSVDEVPVKQCRIVVLAKM